MLNFESVFIACTNCPLFIWSEATVFLSFLCRPIQYNCGLTLLSAVRDKLTNLKMPILGKLRLGLSVFSEQPVRIFPLTASELV